MSFLEGHTTGSTMTQMQTQPSQTDAGHASQLEKGNGRLLSSFDGNIQNTDSGINRQFNNTSLGWVDNAEQDSPTQQRNPLSNQTTWHKQDPKKSSLGPDSNTAKLLPKFRTTE